MWRGQTSCGRYREYHALFQVTLEKACEGLGTTVSKMLCKLSESVWNMITPTVPRCPHLGCALKWNPAERSWDCPCHGSRFAENGKVLDNPANGDKHF